MEITNSIKELYAAKGTDVAFLDINRKIIWSNDPDAMQAIVDDLFINEFEVFECTQKTITHTSVYDYGEVLTVALTPLFADNERKISDGHILEVVEKNDVVELWKNSDYAEKLLYSLHSIYANTGELFLTSENLRLLIEETNEPEWYNRTLGKLEHFYTQIMKETIRLEVLNNSNPLMPGAQCIKINYSMSKIMEKLIASLDNPSRLQYIPQGGESMIAVHDRDLTVAVMCLLKNAFVYSPPDSTIRVRLMFHNEKVILRIVNYIDQKPRHFSSVSPGLGLDIARNVFAKTNGTVTVRQSKYLYAVRVSIPLTIYDTKRLRSELKSFDEDRLSTLSVFIDDILMSEFVLP